MPNPIKADIPKIPDQASLQVTGADLNSLVQSNEKLSTLLEQINTSLDPLKEIREEMHTMRTFLHEELVDEVIRRAIVEKQLDITQETSKLASSMKEQTTILKSVADKLNKTIWVLLLVVTLLGGVPKVYQLITAEKETVTKTDIFYYWDEYNRPFIINRVGDTLYVSTAPPALK